MSEQMTPEELNAPGGIPWYTHYYRVSAENDALRIELAAVREQAARKKEENNG